MPTVSNTSPLLNPAIIEQSRSSKRSLAKSGSPLDELEKSSNA